MAVKISNTLNTFLDQFVIMETNSLETVARINDAMVSKKDYVTLTLTDPSGDNNDEKNTKTYLIPSFWYLEKCINRIDTTLESLMNINNNTDSRVQLADGSYRKIITSQIPCEAEDITEVGEISNFKIKSNWFFEDLLNPCLFVSWSLNGQITDETERVMTQRFILNCDTIDKKNVFNNYFNGNNEINYDEFKNIIRENSIRFTFDNDIRNLPPRERRFTGTFTILSISLPAADYNGHITKKYKLDNIYYTDRLADTTNTRILAVGDFLEVNSRPSNTRYKIVRIEDNEVTLELMEGAAGLNIGSELKISSTQETTVNIEIPVGYDEREVVFIKPIDPISNIPAEHWSPGVGFFSNDLTYTDNKGKTYTLQEFYQKYVIDFGQVIMSYAKDYIPSIREALTPNTPVLNEGNFQVVQVNSHLTDTITYDEAVELVSAKSTIISEIENITNQINIQKSLVEANGFSSDEERLDARIKLNMLVNQQTMMLTEYSSVVNNINTAIIKANTRKQEYAVRGFWEIPESRISPSSGEQKVIKFRVRYRYLDSNNNTVGEKPMPMTIKSGVELEGIYSSWHEFVTKTRERVFVNNEWIWKNVDISDPDEVKINQCDIKIHEGEKLEIKVKAIGEAGWPSNPIESEWSNSIVIDFDDMSHAASVIEMLEESVSDNSVYNLLKP